MPSLPNSKKVDQQLTSRFPSGSTELQTYDGITENDNANIQRNNKSIESDNQNTSNNNDNDNNSNNSNSNKSYWKRIYDKYNPSLTLENKASVARDNLANERTFLAWLRTSLSFISIGVAVTQLFRLSRATGHDQRTNQYDKGGKELGIIFIVLGIVFLAFGVMRYFHSQYLMTKGYFPASRGSIIFGTLLTILSLAACFIIIFVTESK